MVQASIISSTSSTNSHNSSNNNIPLINGVVIPTDAATTTLSSTSTDYSGRSPVRPPATATSRQQLENDVTMKLNRELFSISSVCMCALCLCTYIVCMQLYICMYVYRHVCILCVSVCIIIMFITIFIIYLLCFSIITSIFLNFTLIN